MPEIRAERDSIAFVIPIHGDKRIASSVRLVLRCDPEGNVWACLAGTGCDASNLA